MVTFQYNPTTVTRVFRADTGGAAPDGAPASGVLSGAWPAPEEYALTLELDATDGLERDGPVTRALGIAPRIAALEMLMQPVGTSLLGRLLARRCAPDPRRHAAAHTVRLGSRAHHARADDLADRPRDGLRRAPEPDPGERRRRFRRVRPEDADAGDVVTRAAAITYQAAREAKALVQLEQLAELEG